MNHLSLIGRLGKDPECRSTPSKLSVARFSVAVNRPTKDKETDWFECEAWRQNAEFANEYLRKGCLVALQGRMENHRWEDGEGKRRDGWKLVLDRIQLLERKPVEEELVPL